MHQGLRDEIRRIVLITAIAALGGILSGHLALALLTAGFFYTVWLLRQTRLFYLWLEKNMAEAPPDSGGIWGDIFDSMYHMHQSNIRAQKDMQQQLERFQQFARALPTGIVLLSPQGNLSWWNPAAEKMLGFRSSFDLGKPVINLLRDPAFVTYYEGKVDDDHIILPSPIDASRLLELQITSYGSNEKLLAIQDVTRIRRLEQMRKDFVANVSHELRTPLTVINGFLEPMNENMGDFPEQWRQPLQKIQAQSQRMTDLVNDLGTLSRLDNSDNTDEKTAVALKPLIEKIREDILALHRDKSIQIDLSGESFTVLGSNTELHSCFANLIANAAKYSASDKIEVAIRLWQDKAGAHVAITDNGIGIDPIHIPRLTERFYRVDSSHSRKTGGTGLGLAIVKHVLIRHQGRLSIESAPGKGSTFTCHFSPERTG